MAPQKFGIWEVEEQVGEGSFGIVYRCRDPFLKKYIAVKALKSQLIRSDDPTTLADFFKEAELLAHFNHPAFTHIHYLNPDPPWIAMEFLQGETLESLLQRKEQVGLDRIARIFQSVCDGLHHIHSQVEERYRTVHRDLKPANLLLTRDGGVKIVDFGVAKANIGDPTLVGVVKGTPLYMSPEHMAGTVDSRSDLWSLAVILFETLTGSKPYPDPDPSQGWSYAKLRRFEQSVLSDRYAPVPRTMPPYLGEPLTLFFDRVFQLDKEKRLQSALEFRAALDRIVEQTSRHVNPGDVLLPPLSEVDQLLYQAGEQFDNNALTAARELYDRVLGLDPDNEEAHHWLLQIEDRLAREAAGPAPDASVGPPIAVEPELPAADVDLLRRVLRRPALGIPGDLSARLRDLLQEIDTARTEDRERLRGALSDSIGGVTSALLEKVMSAAERARAALGELEPVNPEAARSGRGDVERAVDAASSADAMALGVLIARLAEVERRAGDEIADASAWLRAEAAGTASHLELLLVTHEGEARSIPDAWQEGQGILAALQAPPSERKPAELRESLRTGAGAIDRLGQEAEAARLERHRERLRLACAALERALPDPLAASLHLGDLRDQTVRSVGAALRWDDPSRLAALSGVLEGLAETAGRWEPELRPPQPKEAPAPPRPPVAPAREAPRPPAPLRKEAERPHVEPGAPRRARERIGRSDEPAMPRGRPILWWGLAGAGIVAAAIFLIVHFVRPPTPVAPADGTLVVDALPWGHLREVVDLDRSAQVPVSKEATTPVRLSLPPGRYRVTVSNPDFGEASVETDVHDGEVRTLGVQLPRFDVEKLLKEF
jgi:serine/threonine protein kinase